MTTIRITCGTLKKETTTLGLKLLHQLSGEVGPQGQVFSNFLLDVNTVKLRTTVFGLVFTVEAL